MKQFGRVLVAILAGYGLLSVPTAGQNVNSHSPITIQSDSDFTGCTCVVSGTGTEADPYIIGPWAINSSGGTAVYIDGTTLSKSFALYNLTIAGNGAPTTTGLILNHVNPNRKQSILAEVSGTATSIQTTNVGILVENSNYVVLDGGGENPSGAGVGNTGAGTINKNLNGAIDVENSSHVTIKGWQLSANGTNHTPDYIAWDPSVQHWGVGGVRFFGVTYSTIDHNAANNDVNISFSLFNSSHNSLTSNTADYPFTHNILLADGSSYNLVQGNNTGTGDFFNIMVADPLPRTQTLKTYGASHDNQIVQNDAHSAGPTGNELSANIVPAFLGGIVLLNGTYNNLVANNNTWADTGADLVWAQAVPNSFTPIGVSTYPPADNCNVTVSEGGGGVSNLNGNVWSGNTYQAIVPCLPAQ